MNITQQIKNLAVGNLCPLNQVLTIINKLDQERETALTLLKKCIPQVGMYLGEELNALVAEMEGTRFSSVDYHHENMPANQRV